MATGLGERRDRVPPEEIGNLLNQEAEGSTSYQLSQIITDYLGEEAKALGLEGRAVDDYISAKAEEAYIRFLRQFGESKGDSSPGVK